MNSTAPSRNEDDAFSDPQGISERTVSWEEMSSRPLALGGIVIEGLTRSRPGVVYALVRATLADVLSDKKQFEADGPGDEEESTFTDVVDGVTRVLARIRATDAFKGADALLDRGIVEGTADLRLVLSEKKLLQLSGGTSISTATGGSGMTTSGASSGEDAAISGSIFARNALGYLESIGVSCSWAARAYSQNQSPSNSVVLEVSQPYPHPSVAHIKAKIGRWTLNNETRSSYVVHSSGGHVEIAAVEDEPRHWGRLIYESTWRDVPVVSKTASMSIVEQTGASWKSSMKHVYRWDGRDSPTTPRLGTLLSLETELAGIGPGDVRFLKEEIECQEHIPIGGNAMDATLSLCLRLGAVVPYGPDSDSGKVRIHDRFFVGGPSSFRGFRTRGVGPQDRRDSLGGEGYCTLLSMLSFPFPQTSPIVSALDARFHVFGCVGALEDASTLRNWRSLGTEAMRASVGVGLAVGLAFGRLEINFCHVLRAASSDKVKRPGIQVGLSHSFG